ncbi:unnamed protein product [Mytilus coruscus]|uniref:LRRCT domain-containing protein n=1 Tax=Mytilus coruscus TaxID=42192 RepID=A0A6J8CK62_MYTCO|nr:unnamed protein product [Mytilus coruscus]
MVNSALTCIGTILLSLTFTIADDCPSPCDCRAGNTIVFCNRTGISEVPKDLPQNTVTLNLGYNNINSIPKDAFTGLKQLQNLDLSGNQFNETSFLNGALNIPSIQTLDLSGGSYMTIPQGLPPNFTTLYFFDNPITTLTANSFVNASSIEYLELRYNQLKSIEDHAFDPLVNASEIDISFNKLVDGSFSPLAFVKNQKLLNLEFRFNALKTFPNTTYFPRTLQHFDVVGNQITVIPSYALRTLTNLQTIEVWEGAITTVEDNAFYGLNKLTILDFMEDHVSSVLTNLTFNGLTALKQLFFDSNQVTKIEVGTFHGMTDIRELWFSSNNLTTLEEGVFDLKYNPNLSVIYLDFNPWICDCHIRWLRQMMNDHPNLIQDTGLSVCSGPPPVAGKSWDVLSPKDFVCK